jgi:hypothetical protein
MRHKHNREGKLTTWAVPLTHASSALMVGMLLRRLETNFWPDLVSTLSASVPDRQELGIGQETPGAPNTTDATH